MSIYRPSVSKIISENANKPNQSGSGEIANLDNIDFLVMGLSLSAACHLLRTRFLSKVSDGVQLSILMVQPRLTNGDHGILDELCFGL